MSASHALILTLNAGSSSIKFAVYGADDAGSHSACATDPMLLAKGRVEGIGTRPHFIAKGTGGQVISESRWQPVTDGAGSDTGSDIRVAQEQPPGGCIRSR